MRQIFRMVLVLGAIVVFCSSASADVSAQCAARFSDAGAVPGTESCFLTAITSRAGLGNFGCTADDGTTARDFCGTAQCPAGSLADFITGQCRAVNCPYGAATETGMCLDRPELEQYDPDGENQAECTEPFTPLPNADGPTQFVNQGLQFHPNRILQNLGLIFAGITGINLVNSVEHAQETGDTRPMVDNIFGLVFPILPREGAIYDAYDDFINFGQDKPGDCG